MRNFRAAAALLCVLAACISAKGENDMPETFPPKPAVYPFKRAVSSMFPVLTPRTVGADVEGEMQFLSLSGPKIGTRTFPPRVHKGGLVNALPQLSPRHLYIIQNRFIYLLDIERMREMGEAPEALERLNFGYENGMVVDEGRKEVMALYSYAPSPQKMMFQYELRIEELQNGTTVKALPVEIDNPGSVVAVCAFGGRHAFVRASRTAPWRAFNAGLAETQHPLSAFLNDEAQALGVITFLRVNEAAGRALILGSVNDYPQCFAASWENGGEVRLIPVGISDPKGRLPWDWPTAGRFLLSPSGKWAFVPVRKDGEQEGCYLVYIDPERKTGYLGPFGLGFDGRVEKVTWVTEPEGLVVHIANRLLYWDLSGFTGE